MIIILNVVKGINPGVSPTCISLYAEPIAFKKCTGVGVSWSFWCQMPAWLNTFTTLGSRNASLQTYP